MSDERRGHTFPHESSIILRGNTYFKIRTTYFNQWDDSETLNITASSYGLDFIFNDLLPPYWTIVQKGIRSIYTDFWRNKIFIPKIYKPDDSGSKPKFFTRRGDSLKLLHEIKHSIINGTRDMDKLLLEEYLRNKLNYSDRGSFSTEERKDYNTLVLIPEQLCWDFALSVYESEKLRGLDLEPGASLDDLRALAEAKFSTYII